MEELAVELVPQPTLALKEPVHEDHLQADDVGRPTTSALASCAVPATLSNVAPSGNPRDPR